MRLSSCEFIFLDFNLILTLSVYSIWGVWGNLGSLGFGEFGVWVVREFGEFGVIKNGWQILTNKKQAFFKLDFGIF